MSMDWEEYRKFKVRDGLFQMNSKNSKCSVCHYYLCTCQSILKDYGFKVKTPLKDLTHNEKIKNCPHNCINQTKKCLDCYDFENFKMVVTI